MPSSSPAELRPHPTPLSDFGPWTLDFGLWISVKATEPGIPASRQDRNVGYTGHGKSEEECGGGLAGPAGWPQRRQGEGTEADGEAAPGERTEGSGGTMVEKKP